MKQIIRLRVCHNSSQCANAELFMCEKCVEIDQAIERYRKIQRQIGDQVAVDRTKELIAELKAQKVAFHPEQGE
jgi:hypothetical protein